MKGVSKSNNPFGELNLRLNPASTTPSVDEPPRTLIVGNLAEDRISEEILYELFLQAGPLAGVRMPRDKQTHRPTGMAFVVFKHQVSVDFALRLMNGIRLYGRELVLTKMGSNMANQPQATPIPSYVAPAQFNSGRQDINTHSHERDQHSYHSVSRLDMIPPPPLVAFNNNQFTKHSPMPTYCPPNAPHSDPGISYSNYDYRRNYADQGCYTDRSRNGSNFYSQQQQQQQHHNYNNYHNQYNGGNYHRNGETPRRTAPYSRNSQQTRGNNWR